VDGLPMATIAFPNLESANRAVQQIDGKQLGNLHLALRLENANAGHVAEHHPQLDSTSGQQGWTSAQPGFGVPTPHNGSPAPPQTTGDGQGWGVSVVACVQQCTDQPALVKLIHRHFVGYEGKPLRELEDLRIKLRSMRVCLHMLYMYLLLLSMASALC